MADEIVNITQLEQRLAALEARAAPQAMPQTVVERVARLEQYLRDLLSLGHRPEVLT